MAKRGIKVLFITILCLSLWPLVQAGEGVREIPIMLKERAGLDWKNTPLTVGVPVPAGNQAFSVPPRVLDQWGREVPSQAVLLSDPASGAALQWWRITFFGSINRNDTLVYRAVPGEEKQVLPRTPVTVGKTANGYLVENSRLRVELKEDEPLIARIWYDPNGRSAFKEENPLIGTALVVGLRSTDGTYLTDLLPKARITLEEEGPIRVVFRINGVMSKAETVDHITYDCRLIMYAESPFLRLELRLANTTGQQLVVEEAWVKTLATLGGEQYETAFGADGKRQQTAVLKNKEWAQVQATEDGRIKWGGAFPASSSTLQGTFPALGWADLTGTDWGVTFGVKDFRQQYPKGLRVNGNGEIQVQLVPSSSRILWEAGVAKTHHLTLSFHGARERDSLKQINALTNKPPVAMPAADWFNQSGVFDQPFLTEAFITELDTKLRPTALLLREKYWSDLLNLYGPPVNGAEINPDHWGIFNYGDLPIPFTVPWAQEGKYWNNNAYDLPYQLLRAYVQTMDPALLEIGEAALGHLKDVDLVNPTANVRPFPGLDHFKDPRSGLVSEATDFRHFENRGLLLGYCLLDDQFAYELALRMADRVILQSGVIQEDLRTLSNGLTTVLAAYHVSGRQRYLDCATTLVGSILAWQERNNGEFPSDFIYKAGLVTDSLVAYYRTSKDPRVLAGIQEAVDNALYHYWDEETGLIQNAGGILFTSALDLLFRETGETKYYEISKTQVSAFANGEPLSNPKDAALLYRTLFSFFSGARLLSGGK